MACGSDTSWDKQHTGQKNLGNKIPIADFEKLQYVPRDLEGCSHLRAMCLSKKDVTNILVPQLSKLETLHKQEAKDKAESQTFRMLKACPNTHTHTEPYSKE